MEQNNIGSASATKRTGNFFTREGNRFSITKATLVFLREISAHTAPSISVRIASGILPQAEHRLVLDGPRRVSHDNPPGQLGIQHSPAITG